MKKLFDLCLVFFLISTVFSTTNLFSQELTHEMTDEERAKMPFYLLEEQTRYRDRTAPSKARSIAEFEKMQGALISYPLGIPVSMVKELSEDDLVYTIVNNSNEENSANSLYSRNGVNLSNCVYVYGGNDSHWTRDYGPWFIAEKDKISVLNFTYNRPRPSDNRIPIEIANFLNLNYYTMNLVHCGGNYMTDGLGVAVSTNLVYEENSSITYEEIKQIMTTYTGTDIYHVTEDPLGDYIKHVDCWGKFLAVDKILITRVPTSSYQYDEYEEIVNYFKHQTSSYGTPYSIYRVYSPNGEPYTNSLILNKKVYVPLENSSADSAALTAYRKAMPGYEVIGFTGNWYSTDAAHCRVKGIADTNMLYINHIPTTGNVTHSMNYKLSADITAYSGMSIKESEVGIYYSIDGGAFQFEPMTSEGGNTYSGTITAQPEGTTVQYYIHAEDYSGRESDYPLIGAGDPFKFTVNPNSYNEKPEASFSATSKEVKVGATVQFIDGSINNPSEWEWSFEGGTPENSTEQNPEVTYNQEGSYSVTLTVSNEEGSDTITRTAYISVTEDVGCGAF